MKGDIEGSNETSIKNLKKLLIDVCEHPKNFLDNINLLQALKVQGDLAHYSDKENQIFPSSLNTMKRICKRIYPRGYMELNELRERALQELKFAQSAAPVLNKRTKLGMSLVIRDLKIQCSQARTDCWHLTTAFTAAIGVIRDIAKSSRDPALLALWKKQEKELFAMFSLTKQPFAKKTDEE